MKVHIHAFGGLRASCGWLAPYHIHELLLGQHSALVPAAEHHNLQACCYLTTLGKQHCQYHYIVAATDPVVHSLCLQPAAAAEAHHPDKDDSSGADVGGGSYRLPGLHPQNSMDNIGAEDGSLPPIGNLSLGKANMAGAGQGQRRSTLPNYYDNAAYSKNKVGAAAAAAAMSKRQGAIAVGAPVKFSKPGQAHKPDAATSFKYKANSSKTNSKYISPYSLRQLAVKE